MWVIGPGGATIYPWSGGWVTMGAPSSFSFIWACLLPDVSLSATCSDCLIYHWNQIWKCRSLHQGPDTLLRVQSGGIMRGALLQVKVGEGEVWGVGIRGKQECHKERKRATVHLSIFFYDSSLHFIFKRNSLFLISVSNEQYHSLIGGLLLFTSSMYWLSSWYITHFMCGS